MTLVSLSWRQACTVCFVLLALLGRAGAAEVSAPVATLGGPGFEHWTGLTVGRADGVAELLPDTTAVFRVPDGPRGWFKHGFRLENDGTADWRGYVGLRFEVKTQSTAPTRIKVVLATPADANADREVTAEVMLSGAEWQQVTLPWSCFAFEQARVSFLKWIKEVQLSASAPLELRNVAAVRADGIALAASVGGKSAPPGGEVEYPMTVYNCTDHAQAVVLSVDRHGWEGFPVWVSPNELALAPGETKTATVRARVPQSSPAGAHEEQGVRAVGNGDGARAATLTLVTAAALPHPNVLHTKARWTEVREKVKQYPWARDAQAEFVRQAEAWDVPKIALAGHNDPGDGAGPCVFMGSTYDHEKSEIACGVAWQLTGDKRFAEKVALFLRRLSDPEHGYGVTWRAINQSLVQEGHFFQHAAMAYDMILDAGVLSDADRAQIEQAFRVFIETIDFEAGKGSINNWNLSEVCGAFYCALALQDLAVADRFFSGPSGIKDQLAKGTLDDGWWYECSIGYNVWCASEFLQAAIAYEPWGYNFRDEKVPANLSRRALLSAELSGGRSTANDAYSRARPFGMSPEIWGPNRRPYREIRDLWNGLLPFLDWRGVMFGVNDSAENSLVDRRIGAGFAPFEIAYFAYRDPAYAALVKRAPKRDLLYGVPELPDKTPERFRDSAYADNVGLALLRSQTPGRPIREQIQAALHYGIHGWAHGHFDRTNLVSLMRYGRSFYNPESIWYGYEPFLYKFYVQTSVAKNMVVVDRKLQESTESERLLFHAGKAMQAAVVQTETRWSNPPYGGMVYDYVPVKTFAEKQWREGRSVPMPEKPPGYGALTGFTEKVLQRRLMIVTDDYVVLADYLRGVQPHVYEALFQMKGFKGLEAAEKTFLRHDAQWDTDPLGSAQFVTDCDWFSVRAPAKSRFEMRWGEKFGADNVGNRTAFNEDGILNLDVHSLWPLQQEIMIGTAPEEHDTQKRLYHTIRGDGRVLAEGKVGAWILGSQEIDVPVDGISQLELETRVELSKTPSVFWAGARLVTRDGREVPLDPGTLLLENVLPTAKTDRDYFGGPVKIVGQEFATSIPAQPKDQKAAAVVRLDLHGMNAVRFRATLGSDYPLGDEAQRRKTYAIREAAGANAVASRFLTVIEPYETAPVVKHAVALSADKLRVELTDGRVQEITLNHFEGDGRDLEVVLTETAEGKVSRTESAAAAQNPE